MLAIDHSVLVRREIHSALSLSPALFAVLSLHLLVRSLCLSPSALCLLSFSRSDESNQRLNLRSAAEPVARLARPAQFNGLCRSRHRALDITYKAFQQYVRMVSPHNLLQSAFAVPAPSLFPLAAGRRPFFLL